MTDGELVTIPPIEKALAEAQDIFEILQVKSMASAAYDYYRQARDGSKFANKAKEIQLRAERKAGEFLAEMPKQGPGEHWAEKRSHDVTVTPTYSEMGIEKMEASRWQKIAGIPDDEFEGFILSKIQEDKELTQAALLRLATSPKDEERQPLEKFWGSLDDKLMVLILDTLKGAYDSRKTTKEAADFLARFARKMPDRIGEDLLGIERGRQPWVDGVFTSDGFNSSPEADIVSSMIFNAFSELASDDPEVVLAALGFVVRDGEKWQGVSIPIFEIFLERCKSRLGCTP